MVSPLFSVNETTEDDPAELVSHPFQGGNAYKGGCILQLRLHEYAFPSPQKDDPAEFVGHPFQGGDA